MRILYVTNALAIWGGLERVLVEKANWLVRNGKCEISILTINQGERPAVYALSPEISLHDLNIPFYQQYRYGRIHRLLVLSRLHRCLRTRLRQQLVSFQPDIIDCVRLDFISDILKVKGHIPLVYESHSSFWASRFEGTGLLRQIHTFWLNLKVRHAQAVVALTNGDAKEWRKVNKSVYVVPNAVHLNRHETYSECLNKSAMFVGRLSRQKGIGRLLDIWDVVHKKHPDWALHIYGDMGDVEDEIRQRLLVRDHHVILHEPTENIMVEYRKHSMLLLSSIYEPFGMVLPEAMSCGLPVVAYDVPYGPADIITDGVDGFLVENNNRQAFAERMMQLMGDAALRQTMGKAAVASAQRYSADKIMPQWKRLFESVVSPAAQGHASSRTE